MHSSNILRGMAANVNDTGSSRSSLTTIEDLEEARQRLLEHQHHQDGGQRDLEDRMGGYYPVESNLPVHTGVTTLIPPSYQRGGPDPPDYGTVRRDYVPQQLPVVTQQPVQQPQQAKTKAKRYRLPFLIMLGFDWGLIIFLSILLAKVPDKDESKRTDYFSFDIQEAFFDLVFIATVRVLFNILFYLVLGWVSRLIMAATTVISAFYVPIKAYYSWDSFSGDVSVRSITILLMLFVSFVLPWFAAFFFEFKFLPGELAQLHITSWKDCRAWFWPRAFKHNPPSVPPPQPVNAVRPITPSSLNYPRNGRRATSTVSLDFRTPVGSSRASPVNVPKQMDDGLPTIGEEQASPECDQNLSAEHARLKREGRNAVEALQSFTSSNDGWTLERNNDSVQIYSKQGTSRKIWKGESVMETSARHLWSILYPGDQTPDWSPQCALNETVFRIDDSTDVVYTATNPMGPVSARDFVSVRQIAARDGCYYSASQSAVTPAKPEQPGKVRGENGPNGYVVIPVSENRTRFIWVLNTNLKGWLPQTVIDQTLSGTLAGSFQRLKAYIQRQTDGGLQ